jgi:hypothetical protein
VRADGFDSLAVELACRPGAGVRLRAEVEPAHAAELIATMPAAASVIWTLHVPLDDDQAFHAIAGQALAPEHELELDWGHPDHEIWIPHTRHDGTVSGDGRVYNIFVSDGDPGCELTVRTVIDHAPLEVIEAWLGERAGVPIAHRPYVESEESRVLDFLRD